MKRNGLFVLVLALAAVLCTGCGVKDEDLKSDPLVNADGTAELRYFRHTDPDCRRAGIYGHSVHLSG